MATEFNPNDYEYIRLDENAFRTSAHEWRAAVELQGKGNTSTVCLFTEPDPPSAARRSV
jgi:hypothetical protein